MTYGSLFSGIGGFDLGFDRAGLQCAWQIEKDKDCNRVLAKHWPTTKRGNDVKEVTTKRYERVDVICGGFPCQDLSVAGKRKGLAGERSGLWHEFHRVIAEFTPRICVIENVPGLFSSNGGRDFLTIIRGLAQLGYCVGWTVLDAQYFNVAQRRERVFIVGSLGNGSCAEILFEPESVRGDLAPSREVRERVAGTLGGSSQSGVFRTTDLDGTGAFVPMVARSINAERDGYNDGSDQTYVPVIADALQERDSKGSAKPGHLIPVAYNIQSNDRGKHRRKDRPHGGFYVNKTDTALTVGGTNLTAIAFSENQRAEVRGEVENPTSQSLRSVAEHNYQFARIGTRVRRLTPLECERLQGFPDDWTRFDGQGKEISDSARYRMLGNAVTVPVADWIGKQIIDKGFCGA